MGKICECEFAAEDPKRKGYSLCEYDLFAKTGLSIRKNIKDNVYEIFEIKTEAVKYTYPTLERAIQRANMIENNNNTFVAHGGAGCRLSK